MVRGIPAVLLITVLDRFFYMIVLVIGYGKEKLEVRFL